MSSSTPTRTKDLARRKTAVATLSVLSNTLLVILKLVIGLAIGSVAVLSEAIHSGIDLLAAAIALFAVHRAAKPSDEDHAFGHGKIENISGTIEALLIFVAAVWIVVESARKLLHPEPLEGPGWGMAVMLVSSAANLAISRLLFKVGKEADSIALQADAWHLRTDVYTSAGVMVGLGLIWLCGWLVPNVNVAWLDPVAAICVALLIVRAAIQLTRESARDLLDARLPQKEETSIRDCIARCRPGVQCIRALRTRKSGSTRFVEVDLFVEGEVSVERAHGIAHDVESAIHARFPETGVTVHVEPCASKERTQACSAGCGLFAPPSPCSEAGRSGLAV